MRTECGVDQQERRGQIVSQDDAFGQILDVPQSVAVLAGDGFECVQGDWLRHTLPVPAVGGRRLSFTRSRDSRVGGLYDAAMWFWLIVLLVLVGLAVEYPLLWLLYGGAAVAGIVWLVRAERSVPPEAKAARKADLEARLAAAKGAPEREAKRGPQRGGHTPPAPSGQAREPWSPKQRQFEVAGESFRPDAFRRLFRQHSGRLPTGPEGAELQLPAVLVPDSANPYDKFAVAVFVDGRHVGYLERADAKVYHAPIRALANKGHAVTVRSRQWARSAGGDVRARVTVMLPEPGDFEPANPLPAAPHVVLPPGGAIQVTKEDEHMDVLSYYALGKDLAIAVTLHSITDVRARSTVDAVEVQLDGERVGILTPTQTANLKPLVERVAGLGLVPVARAILRGNELKADIALYVAKAQDVSPDWLAGLPAGSA